VTGVVGRKPIHLLKDDDRKKVARLEELHIDVGAKDGEEARGMVRIGDVAVIDGDPVELPNGRAVSRSMDNRLGCYVAYEAARLIQEAGGAPGDVVAVAAVQEETTFGGSTTTAYALRPDLAIVVDVTHATDAPGIEVNELGAHPFGSGPVIERGSNLNPRVVELLYETAEAEEIPFTVQASGRHTGTDADAIHISRAGVPCGGIGLPLRYMHSPVEMVQLDDVDSAARLIAAFARRLGPDLDFKR
jgi:endoglucanase